VKVSYFFGSKCEFSQMEEVNIEKVRSYWKSKVEWNDYDMDNSSNIDFVRKYGIMGIPAAVVECLNKTVKIDRKGFNFSQEINQTIYECQTGKIEESSFAIKLVLLSTFVVFLAVYLIRKRMKRKKLRKRKVRKRTS